MKQIYSIIAALCSVIFAASAVAQNQPAPTALSETYQDWVVACQTVNLDDKPQRNCAMSQELRQSESRQLVFSAQIAAPNNEGLAMTRIVAPFGLLLSNGIRFRVDDGETFSVTFRTCLPAGCIAFAGFGQNAVQAMRSGNVLNAIMTNSQSGEDIIIEMSLSGFSVAMDRLTQLQN